MAHLVMENLMLAPRQFMLFMQVQANPALRQQRLTVGDWIVSDMQQILRLPLMLLQNMLKQFAGVFA
ncbi:MAG: hypothetical protein JAZ17_12260 [Candidatus Thiodiazotropha endolucinida]|nr:hypothetical protein [Candidatus Thiodiazotropha taylori]MCG8094372.1 hypothetical protein [Candidatus Thiodiazotropha endolucinida]MCW4343157.1 hypothetical protein [Candidatus Thiodiazotropha endolucinida]